MKESKFYEIKNKIEFVNNQISILLQQQMQNKNSYDLNKENLKNKIQDLIA